MTKASAYSPLDGLVDLACRDGVEIRPTLLRVLTDLYVQKPSHSAEEEAQYVELSLRLIDAVDGATRSAVASRLSTYPNAPVAVLRRLIELAAAPAATSAPASPPAKQAIRQRDLAEEFFAANSGDRYLILTNLADAGEPLPRRPAAARQRSDPPPRDRGVAAQSRRIRAHARARARHRHRHCRPGDARQFRRTAAGRRQGARHAGVGVPAHPDVHQSGGRAIGRARVRTVAALRRDPARRSRTHGGESGARARLPAGRPCMRRSMATTRSAAPARAQRPRRAAPSRAAQRSFRRASSATPARIALLHQPDPAKIAP